ncbi:hypothetical protein GGS24DRAFT_511783 [Hypoxylon argillaceum]|nr:hypothetical protein GGS24DRAFT_511783 [Hypoxylon argillaceum]
MGTLKASANLPSSPWATRFTYDYALMTYGNQNHSTLAPSQPRIDDPKYYDQDPTATTKRGTPTYPEIDRVFLTEELQREVMSGINTWQAATLNRHLRFSPNTGYISGGHRPEDHKSRGIAFSISNPQVSLIELESDEERDFKVYERERIKVDESKWLPFLRKSRWFDWVEVEATFKSEPGRTWSADDPKVWGVMRVILELVNRILEALIEDKHDGDYWAIETQIFGPPPYPKASILLSLSAEKMIAQKRGIHPCPWDWISGQSSKDWKARLVKLLSTLLWSFRSTHPAEAVAFQLDPTTEGHTSMICVNVSRLDHILTSNATLSELCLMEVDLALTMVHELMHTIGQSRYTSDPGYIGNCLERKISGTYPHEPYLNGEGIGETGHNMDQLFFGGIKGLLPIPTTDMRPQPPPLVMSFTEFPHAGYTRIMAAPNSAFNQIGAMAVMYYTPSTWASKMLSEAFWRDPAYPRKSDNSFHRNPLLITQHPNETGTRPWSYVPPTLQDSAKFQLQYPEDDVARQDWKAREKAWNAFRASWWAPYHYDWKWSPWCNFHCRRYLTTFAEAFAKRDSIRCSMVADFLVYQVRWDLDLPTVLKSLPQARPEELPTWAWHCVGLLMLASIPLQRTETSRSTPTGSWATEHTPSIEAASRRDEGIVHLKSEIGAIDPSDNRLSLKPSVLYDQLGGRGQVQDFTQIDYLKVFDTIQAHVAKTGGVVHSNFLIAMMNAKEKILLDRQRLMAAYRGTGHATKFATDWFFEMPEYSPDLCAYSPRDGSWVRVTFANRNL